MNSRAKGAKAEREFIGVHLAPLWPQACRNLDQFGDDKRDSLHVAGVHWQIKRVEKLNIWAALRQAETEAASSDIPVVAFRRNHGGWYCAMAADYATGLLHVWSRDHANA